MLCSSHCARRLGFPVKFLSQNVFEDFSTLRKVQKLSSSEMFFIIVVSILKQKRIDSEDFSNFAKRGARTVSPPRFAVN